MNKILILTAFLCGVVISNAQVDFGIKAVVGAQITPEKTRVLVSENQQATFSVGEPTNSYAVGLSLMSSNSRVFIMGDVLYSRSQQKFLMTSNGFRDTPLDPAQEYVSDVNKLRVIAMGGFKLKKFRVGFGPELLVSLDQTESLSSLTAIERRESELQGGFNFLLGYQVTQRFIVDLKFVDYFEDVAAGYDFGDSPMEMKVSNRTLELSLGVYL